MDTPTNGDLREQGTALLRQGQFVQAATLLTQAVNENPSDGSLWSLLGAAQSSSGNADGAVEAFRRAADLTPAAAKSQFNLGVALQATGATNEARAAFEKAVALDPGYEQARIKLNETNGGPPPPSMGTTNLGGGNSAGLSSVGANYTPPPAATAGTTNLGGGNSAGLSSVGVSYTPPPDNASSGTTNLGGGNSAGLSSVGASYAPPPQNAGTTNLGGGNTAGLSGVGGATGGTPQLRQPTPPPAYGAPPAYGQPPAGGPPPNPYGPGAYAPPPQLGMGYATGGIAPDVKAGQLLAAAIVGLFCFGIILGPYAWINGNKALQTLDQYQNDGGQRGNVTAARIIGIIVTVLSVPGIIYFFIAMAAIGSGAASPGSSGFGR